MIKRLLLSLALLFLVSSCLTRQYVPRSANRPLTDHELLVRAYGATFDALAPKLTVEASKVISPKSGRYFTAKAAYEEEIHYDRAKGYVACPVILQWEARDWWSSVPYGICQLQGWMYYYPRDLGNRSPHVDFFYTDRNNHVVRVSKEKHWEILKKGIRIDLR